MSVEEVIEQIKRMTPEEQVLVREAVGALPLPADDARHEKAQAALERLMSGVCSGGGRHLSAGIDEALYERGA